MTAIRTRIPSLGRLDSMTCSLVSPSTFNLDFFRPLIRQRYLHCPFWLRSARFSWDLGSQFSDARCNPAFCPWLDLSACLGRSIWILRMIWLLQCNSRLTSWTLGLDSRFTRWLARRLPFTRPGSNAYLIPPRQSNASFPENILHF